MACPQRAQDRGEFALQIADFIAHRSGGVDHQHQVEFLDHWRRAADDEINPLSASALTDRNRAPVLTGSADPHGLAQPIHLREKRGGAIGQGVKHDAAAIGAGHLNPRERHRAPRPILDRDGQHAGRIEHRQRRDRLTQVRLADVIGIEFGVDQIVMLARSQQPRLRARRGAARPAGIGSDGAAGFAICWGGSLALAGNRTFCAALNKARIPSVSGLVRHRVCHGFSHRRGRWCRWRRRGGNWRGHCLAHRHWPARFIAVAILLLALLLLRPQPGERRQRGALVVGPGRAGHRLGLVLLGGCHRGPLHQDGGNRERGNKFAHISPSSS